MGHTSISSPSWTLLFLKRCLPHFRKEEWCMLTFVFQSFSCPNGFAYQFILLSLFDTGSWLLYSYLGGDSFGKFPLRSRWKGNVGQLVTEPLLNIVIILLLKITPAPSHTHSTLWTPFIFGSKSFFIEFHERWQDYLCFFPCLGSFQGEFKQQLGVYHPLHNWSSHIICQIACSPTTLVSLCGLADNSRNPLK